MNTIHEIFWGYLPTAALGKIAFREIAAQSALIASHQQYVLSGSDFG